ncbi:PAS domain S-box protein [Candidatus Pacearchaeota archaeon]|nr:PAS domain S-box protein [Candidatus Pacearchaeota archaeon]
MWKRRDCEKLEERVKELEKKEQELKKLEESLRESNNTLRFLAENMVDIIWTADINLRTTYVSPSIVKVLGFTPEERKKQKLEEMVTPESLQIICQLLVDSNLKKRDYIEDAKMALTVDIEYYKKDGSTIWLENKVRWITDENNNIVGLHGVSRDISDKKKAEKDFKESEARLKTILESNPDPIIVYDKNGCTQYLNPAFTKVFGWKLDELKGKKIPYVPEDQKINTLAKIKEIESSGKTGNLRTKRYTKEGGLVDVILNAGIIKSADGKHKGLIVNITDISEQKKLEERFQQSQKMESVGRLAGGLAHDFNNMLTVILGEVEIAMTECKNEDPLKCHLRAIREAALRSADLTKQLLAFARRQTAIPKILDLNNIINSMVKMLRRLIGENIELIWKPEKNLWSVKIDPIQIDQILANLCVNSRDAIDDSGIICIETKNVVLDEVYCNTHEAFRQGSYVMLTVSDNGDGIDKTQIGNIFEPFYTTKELGKGTGLGLATIYGIVKQNYGFINVYSEKNQGTTFKIYFPKAEGKLVDIEKKRIKEKTAIGNETVLVVEDEPAILEIAKISIKNHGYRVLAAKTPSEAITIAKSKNETIDLLITDIVLPEMDGKKLEKLLKNIFPNIKVLFMSGYTENVIMKRGLLRENINFIQKPFSLNSLADKIREVLDQ